MPSNKPKDFNVLAGANATLEWDGEVLYECRSVDARVTLNRTDVQMGIDVGSKLVGASGSITLQIFHIYSRIAQKVMDALRKGHDVRFTIRSRIEDPDAVGGQVESVVLTNVWLNEFPLTNWERDNAESQEYTGGFTPTDAQVSEAVKVLSAA